MKIHLLTKFVAFVVVVSFSMASHAYIPSAKRIIENTLSSIKAKKIKSLKVISDATVFYEGAEDGFFLP